MHRALKRLYRFVAPYASRRLNAHSGFEIINFHSFRQWMLDKKEKEPEYNEKKLNQLDSSYPGSAVAYLGPLLARSVWSVIHLLGLYIWEAPRYALNAVAAMRS